MAQPGHAFHKFPRTSHVHNLGAATRDDLVLHPRDALAIITSPHLVIEEKVDGANLGVSFDPETSGIRFQKRGHYINTASEPQYAKLGAWAANHHDALWNLLGTSRVLYGEWMCARHTVAYDKLPDWFLCFDVLDLKSGTFLSRTAREEALAGSGLHCVRTVHSGALASIEQLVNILMTTKSAYCTEQVQAEGLYLRVDDGSCLRLRSKLVHPDFIQAIEESGVHWSKKTMQCNYVRQDLWTEEPPQQQQEEEEAQQGAGEKQEQGPAPSAGGLNAQLRLTAGKKWAASGPGSKQQQQQQQQGYRVTSKHGVVCLVGPGIEAVAEKLAGSVPARERQTRDSRFGPNHHITLLDPEEVKQLLAGSGEEPAGSCWGSAEDLAAVCQHEIDQGVAEWLPLGLGTCTLGTKAASGASTSSTPAASTAHFCVVCWPAGQRLRAALGLPRRQQFHITLGFNTSDVHGPGADKGVGALVGAGRLCPAPEAGVTGAVMQELSLAAGGPTTRPSFQAAALLSQALDELELAAGSKPSPRPLDVASVLVDLGLELLQRAPQPAGAAEAAAATACGYALKARISGRTGGLDEVLAHADASLELIGRSGAHAPLRPWVGLLRGYLLLQKGKALFGLGRFEEAGDAFVAAEGSASVPGTALELPACAAGAVTLLVGRLAGLFDLTASQQGREVCRRRLQQAAAAAEEVEEEEAPVPAPGLLGGSGPLNPRERFVVPGVALDKREVRDVTLPRNTSWLVPQQLMGSSTPKSREQVFALHQLGVRLVLTLTEETPLPAEWFKGTGVHNLFVPVPNYEPPSVEQMDACMGALEQYMDGGAAVLVHCGGGKGRAGTVLACYMCKHGLEPRQQQQQQQEGEEPRMSAEEAVRVLRAVRPGSIETTQQQSFVGMYSGQLWKRFSQQVFAAGVRSGFSQQQPAAAAAGVPDARGAGGRAPAAGSKHLEKQRGGHAQQVHSTASFGSGSSSPEGRQGLPSLAAPSGSGGAGEPVRVGGWQLPGSYPRTPHLPFSPQVAADDEQLDESACADLAGQEVVVTEKLDGGNCMIFQGAVYARSQRQEASHAWFSMAKGLAAGWRHLVPEHLVLVAENMQAVHSIEYTALTSPLYLLAVWDCALQAWVSWDAVVAVAELLGLPTAPLLFRGSFTSMKAMQQFMEARVQRSLPSVAGGAHVEGFVVRQAGAIQPELFGRAVAKYVRRGHVQTAADWTRTWKQAAVHQHLPVPGPCCGVAEVKATAEDQGSASERGGPAKSVQQQRQQQQQQQQQPKKQGGGSPAGPSSGEAAGLKKQAGGDQAASGSGEAAGLKKQGGGDQEASGSSEVAGCSSGERCSAAGAAPAAGSELAGLSASPPGAAEKGGSGRKQGGGRAGDKAREVIKKGVKLPKLLLLVGLPGSGKSTFAEALVASSRGWVRVCQDECGGSRRTCESAFGHAALRGSDQGRHVILDRCNATVQDRRAWLDLALIGKRDKGVVAVHFDVPLDECVRRVATRLNHPTLPPGRGAKAVASFAHVLQPPTLAEGYERVHVVTSFEQANALLQSMGASKPELAEPELVEPGLDQDEEPQWGEAQ